MSNFFSSFAHRSRRRWFYPLLSLSIALSIWIGVPLQARALSWLDLIFQGVQVIQLSNISDSQEVQLGRQINEQLLSTEFRLYRNRDVNAYVSQIGQRLAPKSERPNLPYTFQVVDDKEVNAFATMGGFVYVTTGLIRTADNEAQLASVLAHEVGHIEARHLVEQMRQAAIQQGIATAAGLDQSAAVGIGVDLVLNRPNSRQAELDADQKGLKTLGRAGYAQIAMIDFMEKLLKNSAGVPTFLSTHPATSDRIAALRKQINASSGRKGDGLNTTAYRQRVRPVL